MHQITILDDKEHPNNSAQNKEDDYYANVLNDCVFSYLIIVFSWSGKAMPPEP